jgi:hypothetical protein
MKKLIVILFLLSTKANALTFGTGFIHTKNDLVERQQYKPSLTIGESWNYKKFNIAINTNRLAVRSNELKLKNGLKLKQKTRYDALQIGYIIKRRWMPALFVANAQVEKKFLNQKTTNNLLIYGASINYLLTKNLSFGFGGTTKNEEGQSFFTNITYRI